MNVCEICQYVWFCKFLVWSDCVNEWYLCDLSIIYKAGENSAKSKKASEKWDEKIKERKRRQKKSKRRYSVFMKIKELKIVSEPDSIKRQLLETKSEFQCFNQKEMAKLLKK